MPPTELSRKPLPCENVLASPKARERRPEAGLLKASSQNTLGLSQGGEGLRPLTVVTVQPGPLLSVRSVSAAQESKLVTPPPQRKGTCRSLTVAHTQL